ncbi:MAG: response regulator [Balneolaceae bacterium]
MLKVHCIEDNQSMQNIYKRMMEAVGFAGEIVTSYNGEEAINYYKDLMKSISEGKDASPPDVIFLDLNMPVMDGWRFLYEFYKLSLPESARPQIYIITSSVNPVDEEKAKEYDVREFITKPLYIDKLEELKGQLNGKQDGENSVNQAEMNKPFKK